MAKPIRIIAVCGAGVATSLMAKMNIEKILKESGYSCTVDAVDVGSAGGQNCDLFVITEELSKTLVVPSYNKAKVVTVQNLVVKNELREKILPVVQEFFQG